MNVTCEKVKNQVNVLIENAQVARNKDGHLCIRITKTESRQVGLGLLRMGIDNCNDEGNERELLDFWVKKRFLQHSGFDQLGRPAFTLTPLGMNYVLRHGQLPTNHAERTSRSMLRIHRHHDEGDEM